MKKTILILSFILCYSAYAQSLSIFDVDTSSFPLVKAKFYAFDAGGKQIKSLAPSDFKLTENGTDRTVLSVTCPPDKPYKKVSIAFSLDVSGSMRNSSAGDIPVELGKTTAKEICKSSATPLSEFALQTCDARANILQDFTQNKNKIYAAIDPVKAGGDNNFVEHLLNDYTGILNIAKTGKYKHVAILYTDAWWYALTAQELQRCKDTCAKYKISFYAVIYTRPEAEPTGIKQSLQNLANATGGMLFDGITSSEAAQAIGFRLWNTIQNVEPCEINWQSGISCVSTTTNVVSNLTTLSLTATTSYQSPNSSIARLVFNPATLKMLDPTPGIKKDTTITVTAHNSDFNIASIVASNPAFTITPTNFSLKVGESKSLKVSYFPADSGYNYTKFEIVNDMCKTKYYVSGGWKGRRASIRTLKLLHPNGGEVFIGGTDTIITWEGISPDEPVILEYQINNGSWIKLTDTAKGLKYNFHVPRIESNKFLARVTAKAPALQSNCPNGDVLICNQLWMGCNLDVDTYRNGDPIPEVKDQTAWASQTTGAWCYYNNDPAMGAIYGKLYNWYALNDPRGLAPEGWHIASDEEWKEMEICLGMSPSQANNTGFRGTDQGGKLKEIGYTHWSNPNSGATNESGFTCIGSGYRHAGTGFTFLKTHANFWTPEVKNPTNSWYRGINYDNTFIYRVMYSMNTGFSVRCIRD